MNNILSLIKKEYQTGKSAKEVGETLGIPERKVRSLMEKAGIVRRSWSEATYCKRNPQGDPFKIAKQLKSPKDLSLFFTSIGLYLGEGTKKGKHSVALGNSDPRIIKTFLAFLRRICKVEEYKIFAELNIFDDVSLKDAICFWTKNVGISKDQIHYKTIRKSKGGSYKNKSKHGTLTLKVSNSKLKQIILEWCDLVLKDCALPA